LPTPVARSPLNVYEGIAPDDLNQLLGTHAPVVTYDNSTALIGAVVVGQGTLPPMFQYFRELVSPSGQPVSIDQPITMSGTVLDRVELPISVLSGVGQDVLVGLYANSAGVPTGLPLAQTYVPKEMIPAAGTNLPGHGLLMSGQLVEHPTMVPPAPYDTYSSQGFVSDGVVAIFIGGNNGTVTTNGTVIGLMSPANGNVTQWSAGPAYPPTVTSGSPSVTYYGLSEMGVAVDAQSYVYAAGGMDHLSVPSALVYSAQYSSNPPTIDAWQPQVVLPVSLVNNACIVISSSTTASPILYSVGGIHSTPTCVSTVYAATLASPGSVGAWSTPVGSQFPTGIAATTLVQINGYLVAIGGITNDTTPTYTTAVWAAKINSDNTIGSWHPWPALPGAYQGWASVYGNSIVFMQQNQAFSLDVSTLGQPDPVWQNCSQQFTAGAGSPQIFVQACVTGNYLMSFTTIVGGTTNIGSMLMQYVSEMSVPLHATGLSNATKYHIIVSPMGSLDQYNVTQIALTSSQPTTAYASALASFGPAGAFGANDQNILPSYMSGSTVSSGWDTPSSNRFTSNCVVTYGAGVVTLTAITSGSPMETTTDNSTYVPDLTGLYAIPVNGGVEYVFTALFKCAATPQSITTYLLLYDANGNFVTSGTNTPTNDSVGGVTITATATVQTPEIGEPAFAVLQVLYSTISAPGEVHTMQSIAMEPVLGYVPLSLFVSGKNLRPIHVLDDIANTQPFGWNWITYDYSGKPIQIAECILPRVNLIAPNDSNMGGPVAGTATGWTAGANTALAAVANASQPLGAPLPNTPGVPAFPVINSQQCAYELSLTNSSGGSATVSATTATGTSGYAVTAGQNYTAFAYFLAATTGRTVTMQIIWYNAAGGTISTSSGTGTPDVTTGWTQVYVNAVAPALAVTAAVSISIAATATTEAHGATCVQFALDNSLVNGFATPMLAYFEPGSGPGGMRNLVKLAYDTSTSQLVSVTPNNPLTYFGTGATATYTAISMTDTQAVWPMNGLVGQVITAPSDIGAISNSATTNATVLFNIGNTIILTAAGWSNGQPDNGSSYSIT
jgi:hypothetical protein